MHKKVPHFFGPKQERVHLQRKRGSSVLFDKEIDIPCKTNIRETCLKFTCKIMSNLFFLCAKSKLNLLPGFIFYLY
jgi:hypothetical protein